MGRQAYITRLALVSCCFFCLLVLGNLTNSPLHLLWISCIIHRGGLLYPVIRIVLPSSKIESYTPGRRAKGWPEHPLYLSVQAPGIICLSACKSSTAQALLLEA